MKNFEKFETEIMEIVREGYNIAIQNGLPIRCQDILCVKCDCHGTGRTCKDEKRKWMESEYKERPKLTKQERKFCELFEGKDIWFATDKDSISKIPVVYTEKPVKNAFAWSGDNIITQNFRLFIDAKFDFIKWEDEEPWSIEDLLKLEVEE